MNHSEEIIAQQEAFLASHDKPYGRSVISGSALKSLFYRAERAEKALQELMQFVLEDYFPDCATPEFKQAVEKAKEILSGTE